MFRLKIFILLLELRILKLLLKKIIKFVLQLHVALTVDTSKCEKRTVDQNHGQQYK